MSSSSQRPPRAIAATSVARRIDERYLFVVHPEQSPSLEWILDKAEVAVVRHGARIVQVDPWNRMEASRARDETETEYIGRCLRNLHAFAHDMNVHLQILAHPAKMGGDRKNHPPLLEDISGSKNWDNMVDQGFVVHRPKTFDETGRKPEANFYHRKARFDELGYRPAQDEMMSGDAGVRSMDIKPFVMR